MREISRRHLLTAAMAGGAILGTQRQANAFSEGIVTVKARALHENACGPTASHKEMVAEVDRLLGDRYSEAEKKEVVASLTCPICGCPLAGLF
jgi:hypothetical protein